MAVALGKTDIPLRFEYANILVRLNDIAADQAQYETILAADPAMTTPEAIRSLNQPGSCCRARFPSSPVRRSRTSDHMNPGGNQNPNQGAGWSPREAVKASTKGTAPIKWTCL